MIHKGDEHKQLRNAQEEAGQQQKKHEPPKEKMREVEFGMVDSAKRLPAAELSAMVYSRVDWKKVPQDRIQETLKTRAREIFAGASEGMLASADSVIDGIGGSGTIDWQYGQIIENWMVFINFASRTGLYGPEGIIRLNEVSFSERARTYSERHSPEAQANRAAVNGIVVDALEKASAGRQAKGAETAGFPEASQPAQPPQALSPLPH